MQLPTSVIQSPLNSPIGQRPAASTDNRTAREPERAQNVGSATEANPAQRQAEPEDQQSIQAPERVAAPNQAEVPTQDPALRESVSFSSTTSQNPALNQYQQVAQQGVDNVQAQDPSLFRVDVYV